MISATSVAAFGSAWGMIRKTAAGIPIGTIALVALVTLAAIGIESFLSKTRTQTNSEQAAERL